MPDFARVIVDHFLARCGTGSAISSADQALLLGWEAGGVPLDVVLQGIDRAFEERREAPRSLTHCRAWVRKAQAGEEARHGVSASPEGPGGGSSRSGASASAGRAGAGYRADAGGAHRSDGATVRSSIAERFARDSQAAASEEDIGTALLRQARDTLPALRHPVAKQAYAMIVDAMEEALATEDGLDASTLALLDAALVEAALRALPSDEADALRASVDATLAPQTAFLSPARLQARRSVLLRERLDALLDGFPGIG